MTDPQTENVGGYTIYVDPMAEGGEYDCASCQ